MFGSIKSGHPLSERSHFAASVLPAGSQVSGGSSSPRNRVLFRVVLLWVSALAVVAGPALNLRAEPPSVLALSEYQKQNWEIEDGLPENNVRMLAQKPDGTLLLATASGIASFDGQRFHSLPINDFDHGATISDDEAINAIFPDGNDNLWIGTDGHGVLYQTPSGTINLSERNGFFHERIRMFYRDAGGVVWIGTQNGVERFINGKIEAVVGSGMISGDITNPFAEDGHGGMFFVTSAGLFHWKNGAFHPYQLHLAASDLPVAVYRDLQQRIWVGTMKHIVQLVPIGTGAHDASPQFTEQVRGRTTGAVTVLLGDAAGNLWIGTRHEGIMRLAQDGLSDWSSRDGLQDDAIRAMFVDDEQNLWIGMASGGLSRWRKGALAPYGDPEGFHATFSADVLADKNGDLWLGTWGNGLFRRHKGELISMNLPNMPITTPIRALAQDRFGQIWVGTWFSGVYRYDGHGFQQYLLGNESPGNAVSAILPAKNGGLWVGTYTGLLYFPNGQPSRRDRLQFLDSQLITCLLEDGDGSILVGTNSGLYRVRNGGVSAINGLAHSHILSLTLDSKGYVWASAKGDRLFAVLQDHAVLVPPGAGLSNLTVNTAIEDRDGHLWLGTSHGIVRVKVDELHAVVNGRQNTLSLVKLDKADGMRSSECGGSSQPASSILPNGTLWFATAKGYVHTTDVAEKLDSPSPVASITGWTPSIDPNSADLVPTNSNSRIDLEAGHTDVLVFFNAKLLANPAHIEFRYRLAGYDSGWTMTRARVARYRRLPPGKYRFEVEARRSGEQWLSPVASLPVEQRPYLYQTWYFYFLLFVLLAASTIYLVRYRVRKIKGRMGIILEERNRIARECHDSLMAGFAAVSWQLEATSKLFRDSNTQSTAPAESCELARSMVTHCQAEARRIIWDLRDTDEVTGNLSHAMTRSLFANPAPEAIETNFYVSGDEVPLAPGCVHQMVCIGQEAVSNAIRHAEASRIAVHLKYESDSVTMTVSDNGRGFQNSGRVTSLNGHFGISVMEERARKLGGTLRIQTSPGAGTEVAVRVGFNAMNQ